MAKLRASIAGHVPEIIGQLAEAAKGGDVQAARILLERVLPPMKPTELAVPLALPDGSLTDQGRAVLAAVVHELRRRGLAIEAESVRTASGKRIARYRLAGKA